MTDQRATAGIAHPTVIPDDSSRDGDRRHRDGTLTNVDGPHVTVVPSER